jgi:putative membrane protein
MRHLILRWIILAVAIWLTAWFLPGVEVRDGMTGLALVALVFGLVNAFIRPILTILTCPLIILTLGLFTLVINALMLSLTAWLVPNLLSVSGVWTTLLASLIISLVSAVLSTIVAEDKEH